MGIETMVDDEDCIQLHEVDDVDAYEFYIKRDDAYPVDYVAINAKGMRFPLCVKVWEGDQKKLKTFANEEYDLLELLERPEDEEDLYDDWQIQEIISEEEYVDQEYFEDYFPEKVQEAVLSIIEEYRHKFEYDAWIIADEISEWIDNNKSK